MSTGPDTRLLMGKSFSQSFASQMASLVPKGIIVLKPENVAQLVFFIRGEKVLLDADLAMLYGVEPRVLNQAVARNRKTFPSGLHVSGFGQRVRRFDITDRDLRQG